jgi:hypothetical protein
MADITAVLSLSVPQEVNTISSGTAFKRFAICSLALLICLPTCPPKLCMLEAFPYISLKKGSIASTTSGATCVVALLSK